MYKYLPVYLQLTIGFGNLTTHSGKDVTTKSDEIFGKFQRGGGIFNPKIYIAVFGTLNRAF